MFLKKNNLPFGTCTYVVNVGNVGCSQLETKLSQKPQDMRTQNTCFVGPIAGPIAGPTVQHKLLCGAHFWSHQQLLVTTKGSVLIPTNSWQTHAAAFFSRSTTCTAGSDFWVMDTKNNSRAKLFYSMFLFSFWKLLQPLPFTPMLSDCCTILTRRVGIPAAGRGRCDRHSLAICHACRRGSCSMHSLATSSGCRRRS